MDEKNITGANVVSGDHATIIASQTIINYTVNSNNTNSNIGSPVNDSAVIIKLLAQLEEKDRQIEALLNIIQNLKANTEQ